MLLFALAYLGLAQSKPIDVQQSRVTVRVFKSGLFSAFAHDHTVEAPISAGSLDTSARTIQLSFRVLNMKVLDPGVRDKDRAEIERTMKSDKVLDAERFPEIKFVSNSVEARDATHFIVRGDLFLHGSTGPVEMVVTLQGGRYTGSVKLKQTDSGIAPVSAAGGAVKVKDTIEIIVQIVPGK
jgi:YceI-like domain